MIIVRITGGPGNQMFQYAAARRLAYIHNTSLKLDLSEYKRKTHRRFLLDKFNIRADYATPKDIKCFYKFSYYLSELFQPVVHKILRPIFNTILYEKHFHFDKSILSAPDNIYLIGFWQSKNYFSDVEQIIRREFTLKNKLSNKSKELLEQIKNTRSVSISIRRGDFVTDPDINRRHGVLDLSYYKQAISYLVRRIKKPHFYIFSDDLFWVKENFKIDFSTTYVDFNFPDRVYEDMILGSACQHNIIANSTFAWWVAWLNNYKEKIVIAPKKWFYLLRFSIKDLIPKGWVKI